MDAASIVTSESIMVINSCILAVNYFNLFCIWQVAGGQNEQVLNTTAFYRPDLDEWTDGELDALSFPLCIISSRTGYAFPPLWSWVACLKFMRAFQLYLSIRQFRVLKLFFLQNNAFKSITHMHYATTFAARCVLTFLSKIIQVAYLGCH